MKNIKFLAVVVFACISMYATAAVTAKVNIKVQGTLYDEILIVQDDAAAANFADKNNANKIMNSANSWCLNIYALNGADKLGAVVNPVIDGLELEFQSSTKESEYTMSFSDVIGTITLNAPDSSFVIDATKTYAFTCTAGDAVKFSIAYGSPASVDEYKAAPAKEGKMIVNGKLVIIRDGQKFNAQGARL